MAGSLQKSPQRESLCGPVPDIDTSEISSLAQTAEYDHPAADSPQLSDAQSRYRILERVGAGGFGVVFKAWDAQLERTVAIKVLRPGGGDHSAAAHLAEARTLARLDHPAIVPVYDLGRTASGDLLIVSKFIEGRDLGAWIKSQRMTPAQAAQCAAVVAEALGYAHAKGIVHRDVKPGNILLTAAGDPVLSDFGLALHDNALGSGARFVGTPAYMSPEQARSEGHRVDGRSDIYSLGTVFYELLTGNRPFQAKDADELLDFIRNVEARPPRQIDRAVPRELERICLKALAKRASDRYSTAGDMASDLRDWLLAERAPVVPDPSAPASHRSGDGVEPSGISSPPIVVPHGLRSFDESDADFFLHLLPGARDREGIPECVRFWKRRIESVDPGESFRVGVLLGPSGSGKSSLLRAGIVPLLDERIQVIVVDAGPAGLEERLRRRLARELTAEDSEALSLHDLAVRIRKRGLAAGKSKLLIVIDQFEQWLNLNEGREHTPLAEALRQCDGVTLQAMLLARDDFTIPIARFLEELEEPLLQNRNFAAIDRFSAEHAAKVLEAFGRAYRAWPHEPTRENRRFIDQAVAELGRGGAVVPVQLAALAEIIKERPWTEATLRQLGGVQGVAVQFLEQRLVGERGHPEIRLQLPVVRRLLHAFLPGDSENIRGPAKTRAELLHTLGDAITPERLDKLLQLLDVEVRLITPVRGGSSDSSHSDNSSQREPAYQLTHDYLVSAIRAWLSANERGTRSGRARWRLRELAESWNAHPEPQRLPTLLEWATIRGLTRPGEWSPAEQRMMNATSRRISIRAGIVALSLLIASVLAWQTARFQAAQALYARLLAADTSEVPAIVAELLRYDGWTLSRVRQNENLRSASEPAGPAAFRRTLHRQLALAPKDAGAAQFVVDHLDQVEPKHLSAVVSLLVPQRAAVSPGLWRRLQSQTPDSADEELPAACVLAALGDRDPAWREVAPRIVRRLIAGRPALLPDWLRHLGEQRAVLVPELLKLLEGNAALTPSERNQVFESLAVLAQDDPESLVLGLERVETADLASLWPTVERRSAQVCDALERRLTLWTRTSNAASDAAEAPAELAALVRRWTGSIDRRWAYVAACPREEFDALAARLKSAGYAPLTLRTFAAQGQETVSAAFDRSSRNCRWQFNLPTGEAVTTTETKASGNWALCDFAPSTISSGAEERFTLLWEQVQAGNSHRVVFNARHAKLEELREQLEPQGFGLVRCSSRLDESGRLAYSALWRRSAAGEISGSHTSRYAGAFGELYPGSSLADVRLHILEPGTRDAYAPTFWWEDAEHDLQSARSAATHQTFLARVARYALLKGDAEAVLEATGKLPPDVNNLVRKATAAARLGDTQTLAQVIPELQKLRALPAVVAQLQVRLALLEHRLEDVSRWLATIEKASGSDNRDRLASSLALAGAVPASSEPLLTQVQEWRTNALLQLQRILNEDAPQMPELTVFDQDFDALRSQPEFQDLLRKHGLNRRYDSVWQDRKDIETRLVYDVGAAEHERLAKELSGKNYTLVCLEVKADPGTGQHVMASVWRRQAPAAHETVEAARRIARLAASAARLGQADPLIDVLCDRYGREARAQLIEIAPAWLAIERLLELLKAADSVTLERHLLLALGSAAPPEPTAADAQRLFAPVERLVLGAGDASLSAAADWCAKQWRLTIKARDAQPAGGGASLRTWHVNSVGQVMIVLEPPDQFLMGSPKWEKDRVQKDGDEQLHWQRIGRRFSIAATETTVALFKEFLEDPRVKKAYEGKPFLWTERYAPALDCPQTAIRWYDAVRFCQWLTEHERIPEADWCYPGVLDAATDKWQFPANLLERRGYRLPTEAEWEYACRGGSAAAYSYGDDRRLLGRYAWYLNNADEKSHAVATLMPNDFGLFDTMGNVHEWCHDVWGIYKLPLAGYLFHDRTADPPPTSATQPRVLRGGSFETLARQLRSADRSLAEPAKNHYLYGFRVARTEAAQAD
jgi:eukaryotic-like serine/threonine-protein kinase